VNKIDEIRKKIENKVEVAASTLESALSGIETTTEDGKHVSTFNELFASGQEGILKEMGLSAIWGTINLASTVFSFNNKVKDNPEGATVELATKVLNIAKVFDPTGIAGIIVAFIKENCYYSEDFTD